MFYFRILIFGLILGCFYYFFFDYTIDNARDKFFLEEYEEAAYILSHLKDNPEQKLLLAYTYRALNQIDKSDLFLQDTVNEEGFLNLALNAYLRKDFIALKNVIQKMDPENGWVDFFSGVVEYHQKNYPLAIQLLESNRPKKIFSAEMAKAFDEYIPLNLACECRHHLETVAIFNEAKKALYFGDYQNLLSYNKSHLASLKQEMIDCFYKNVEENRIRKAHHLAEIFNSIYGGEDLRKTLLDQYLTKMEESLVKGNYLENDWKKIRAISPDPERLENELSNKMANRILESPAFFKFWDELEKNQLKRSALSLKLLNQAESFWVQREEGKAVALIKLAYSIPQYAEKQMICECVQNLTNRFFREVLSDDEVRRFPYILELVESLKLENSAIYETADHMEDALYFMKQNRFQEAQDKARWVLRIEPENIQAKNVLGLIAYHNAFYYEALEYLENGIEKTVSKIILGIIPKDSIEIPISQETLLRLGFGALMYHRIEEAKFWFLKCNPEDPEVQAGMAFTTFKMHEWNEVLRLINHLKPPYSRIDRFQGMVVESFIALGKIDDAENAMRTLFKWENKLENAFTPYFQRFKTTQLDNWDRNVIAAHFYKDYRKDYEKALYFFNKIEPLSVYGVIEKSKVLIHLKQYSEAEKQLKLVDHPLVLPLLAKIKISLGRYSEAYYDYKSYFLQKPDSSFHRMEYVFILMKNRRYDIALEQLKYVKKLRTLNSDELMDYVDCLVHLGDFESAHTIAESIHLNLSVQNQIRLAELLVTTRYESLMQLIMGKLPKQDQMSVLEKQAYTRLLHALGEAEGIFVSEKSNDPIKKAHDLILKAIDEVSSKKGVNLQESMDLNKAHTLLEKLAVEYQDLPEVFYLLGKSRYLLNDNKGAIDAYRQALKLDISYVEVYHHLALVYEEESDIVSATEALLKAAKFEPIPQKIWSLNFK